MIVGMTRDRWLLAVVLVVAAGSAAAAAVTRHSAGTESGDAAPAILAGQAAERPEARYLPQFTADGDLRRPEGWEAWVLAGTSMGLTYAENPRTFAPGEAPGSFLNVYIQPWAYEAFMELAEFPDGTMLVLAGSEPVRKADPARGGFYQGDLHLMEVHLKREGIDPSGWAFYGYGSDAESAAKIPGEASCYSCHAENAGHDNVFVQFYPRIRERLGYDSAARSGSGTPTPPAETTPGGGE